MGVGMVAICEWLLGMAMLGSGEEKEHCIMGRVAMVVVVFIRANMGGWVMAGTEVG